MTRSSLESISRILRRLQPQFPALIFEICSLRSLLLFKFLYCLLDYNWKLFTERIGAFPKSENFLLSSAKENSALYVLSGVKRLR
jgi:hypothetical protein